MYDVAIIIVNYNTRDLLQDCLQSIYASIDAPEYKVYVVDNASTDGSAEMVSVQFPQVQLIASPENGGYACGNNLGLKAVGFTQEYDINSLPRYVLLLNPDTVLPPTALRDMVDYLDAHPEAGAAGPKLVRQDGTLDVACRRSFPSPKVAFYRLSGLSRIFPKSKRFNRYNMGYLSPDEETEVDAIVGAFALIRREALLDAGVFLDESFYMYGEDLDLFLRIHKAGWTIRYNPAVTVLHYKGQSTRQRSSLMIWHFYRSMIIFHNKHYRQTTFFIINLLIYAGIAFLYVRDILKNVFRPPERRGVGSAV